MCSDDADLKPQEEEEEETKDDSLPQNGMQCDEGHIDVHSHPRACPTPPCFIFTVTRFEMWLNCELHWNIDGGGVIMSPGKQEEKPHGFDTSF